MTTILLRLQRLLKQLEKHFELASADLRAPQGQVTNIDLISGKVVISYEKRVNSENYIKEAKYDMAVGQLLLKSFWANEAVFKLMILAFNLYLLFKFDSLSVAEYRQQIKTFRLKYFFLAAKIIKTARNEIMKLSFNYPYKAVYERCLT